MSPTIKSKEWTEKELLAEISSWDQERINKVVKLSKSRALRVSRAKRDMEEIQAKFLEVFKKLYKTSKHFKNAIDNISQATHPFEPGFAGDFQNDNTSINSLHDILFEWNRQKRFYKRESPNFLNTFALLVNLCKKITSEYETDIIICKLGNDVNLELLPIVFTPNRTDRIVNLYNVRGKTIKQIEVDSDEISAQNIKVDSLFDLILIYDSNSPPFKSGNVLTDGIAGMSRFTPTLVGYINREGNKKLLVSFPEYFNPTAFKEYERYFVRYHRNFYGKSYKGRPKEMSHQLTLMEKIWREKCGGKKLSANQQSKILSDELREKHDINLEPITIIRWYLPYLKGRKRDKN
jgi:hypothetical protein